MRVLREGGAQLRAAWIDRPWLDYVAMAVIVGAYAIAMVAFGVYDILGSAPAEARRSAFTATAIIVSLMTSFSAAALGQAGSARGERMDTLRRRAGDQLARTWRGVFRVGLLAALLAVLALLVDVAPEAGAAWQVGVRWAYLAGLTLAIVRFLRLSALFTDVMAVATADARDPEEEERGRLEPNPEWHRRAS